MHLQVKSLDSGVFQFVMRTLGLWINVSLLRDVVRALIMDSRCWIRRIVHGGRLVMHGCHIIIMIIWD